MAIEAPKTSQVSLRQRGFLRAVTIVIVVTNSDLSQYCFILTLPSGAAGVAAALLQSISVRKSFERKSKLMLVYKYPLMYIQVMLTDVYMLPVTYGSSSCTGLSP